jgi:TolB-like protein/tetratricopeptide (TPR) repeat protein
MSDHYEFGEYRLDARSRTLFRGQDDVYLPTKAAELLAVLLQSSGQVLTREELIRQLWPGMIVEDGSLTSQISLLRKTFGDGSQSQVVIETLPKRGYRLIATVKRVSGETTNRETHRIMLVVLPFENYSAGERYDYFSEGLTEEMIAELARLSPDRLRVIARTSAMHFKSTTKTIAQIGSELDASHVLEGSVRRSGDRVRITAQLIRVSDESHLWAQSYDRDLHDVLAVQAEVAGAVAREIQITLTPNEQRRLDDEKARAVNSQAYELFLRGRHFGNRRTEQGIRKSIDCFEEALSHDPNFAAAYGGISDAHTMLACRGICPAVDSFHKAKAAARQAVKLQPKLGEGYASLAHVRLHDWDWVELETDFQQAVQLDPGYAIGHYWYAEYLTAMGRTREALARVQHSRTLDPLNPVLDASVGMIHYLAHDFDGALVALRRGLEIDPTHYVSHLRVGLVCLQKSSFNDAIAAMEKAVDHSGGSTEAMAGLAQAQAAIGNTTAMEEILNSLSKDSERYVSPYNLARVCAAMNDKTGALQWLETAYREHNPDLIEVTREPAFAGLHTNEKFRDLVRRIGWRQ